MTRAFLFSMLLAMTLMAACKDEQFDKNSYIELKKDPCFGFCPVYTFRVDGTGKAIFDGQQNVDKYGQWVRQLSKEETASLFNAFAEADFWSFKDEYTDQVSDLPTVWITFSNQGRTKQVKDYFGAPSTLKDLEALVEAIAESNTDWQQTGNTD